MSETGWLDPAYHVIPMPGGDVQLRAENGHMLILKVPANHQEGICNLLRQLQQPDQQKSLETLAEESGIPQQVALDILGILRSKWHLLSDEHITNANLFVRRYTAESLTDTLRSASLCLSGSGALYDSVAEILTQEKVDFTPWEPDMSLPMVEGRPNLLVTCLDGEDLASLEATNKAILAHQWPWFPCRWIGGQFHIGPAIIPYRTSCLACYYTRQLGAVEHFEEFSAYCRYLMVERSYKPWGHPPWLTRCAAGWVVWEMARILLRQRHAQQLHPMLTSPLYGRLLIWDPLTYKIEQVNILRLPNCRACGQPVPQTVRPNPWDQRT